MDATHLAHPATAGAEPTLHAHFERLFRHMAWADARLLALPELAGVPAAMRTLSHLLAAERVWLLRLRGEDASAQPIWPDCDPGEARALAAENASGYAAYLAHAEAGRLRAEIGYANSQGVAFRTRVADVLTHVAMHGSYHRGQIAAAVRAAGGEPVNTDFITFVREAAPPLPR
jgi:uncharacterized damage-inducible protein DinB